MAAVLAAMGTFLYLRLASNLDDSIDHGLRARGADVAALVAQADEGLREGRTLRGPDDGFAQVIAPSGRVVDSTAGLADQPLLTSGQRDRAQRGEAFFDRKIEGEDVRLLAEPLATDEARVVVVVGASLEPRAEALEDLETQLLIGGPIALVIASLAGYQLAAAALRPVDRMGERAATISAASSGRRLPVSRANDEISRLGTRLNAMLGRLEGALERERELVANASHELRTPLALLKTEIELALDEPDSAPELATALRSAGAETDRLAQLADDLLLLARADAGQLPLRRAQVSIPQVLDTIATRFLRRATDAGRHIEVTAPAGLMALADRRRLEQALSNLVENALRHGAGTVRLDAVQEPGAVLLHVTDEGPGFAPEFRERAFERFSRADGSAAGAGLGLAIVAVIANAHGGTVTASHGTGGGADVELRLPVRPPERAAHQAPPPP